MFEKAIRKWIYSSRTGKELAVLLMLCSIGIAHASSHQNSVAQYGITWQFDKEYLVGQFANGDYWVKADDATGYVVITRITPDFTGTANGWQANPRFDEPQGFDEIAGDFSPGQVPLLPYNAQPGESILKAISFSALEEKTHQKLKTAAVLTVVDEIPPGDGLHVFRPGYAGEDKTYYFLSDIRLDRILSIPTEHAGVSYESLGSYKMVQVEHKGGAVGRRIRPNDNMGNDYAPAQAGKMNNAIAKLNGPDSLEEKMELLINVIQAGIDRHNAVLTGQTWPAGGGHQPGHKLSVAFSAYMLDHQGMKDAVSDTFWWENRMIRDSLWGSPDHTTEIRYWEYMGNDPGYNLERWDPYRYIDGGNNLFRQINGYQIITGNNVKGAACWLRYFPEMQEFWSDSENFILYAERWVSHGLKAAPDPCAPMHPDDIGKQHAEWNYYGITYGPDGNGDCIKGEGRFNDNRDGMNADTGQYQSSQMNEMWLLYYSSNQSMHDTTAPMRSNGQPTGYLPAGTAGASVSLATNEPANCRYSLSPGTSYQSMQNTFSTTGGTSHSQQITGLESGAAYNYYVRCIDTAGNSNPDDFIISFGVLDAVQCSDADTDMDGVISMLELTAYISEWKEGAVPMPELMAAIKEWKYGCT